jgi:ribosomal protein L7/L12
MNKITIKSNGTEITVETDETVVTFGDIRVVLGINKADEQRVKVVFSYTDVNSKIRAIKCIRNMTYPVTMGLGDAKQLVEGDKPWIIITRAELKRHQTAMQESGASYKIEDYD